MPNRSQLLDLLKRFIYSGLKLDEIEDIYIDIRHSGPDGEKTWTERNKMHGHREKR
jgi:hypothetical protein